MRGDPVLYGSLTPMFATREMLGDCRLPDLPGLLDRMAAGEKFTPTPRPARKPGRPTVKSRFRMRPFPRFPFGAEPAR